MPKTRANHKLSYAEASIGTSSPLSLGRRWVILLAFLLVVLAGIVIYGGPASVLLLTDLVLEGCYLAFWLAAATALLMAVP